MGFISRLSSVATPSGRNAGREFYELKKWWSQPKLHRRSGNGKNIANL
jgi:hypothetical protein